jgi:hypothetical protein
MALRLTRAFPGMEAGGPEVMTMPVTVELMWREAEADLL